MADEQVKINPVRIQRNIALLSVLLFLGKMLAWYLTHSVTVLTDALEGIVNMIAGFLGLFSIILASRPRDTNHPYGHGKAEFLSSAVEGTLIVIAGIIIIYEGVLHIITRDNNIKKLDTGLLIVVICGLVNFAVGWYAEKKGKKSNSMILVSAGSHLKADAYSTIAIIIGLCLLLVTNNKWWWLDSTVAMCFAIIIIITGTKVLRRSIGGIMDEMDMGLLHEVITLLQEKRQPQWVDLHNLRVIQYGSMLHVDAHMTIPWYYLVAQAEKETETLERLIKTHFSNQVELFIHIDGCKPFQCKLCALEGCPERKHTFEGQVEWTVANLWANTAHGKSSNPV